MCECDICDVIIHHNKNLEITSNVHNNNNDKDTSDNSGDSTHDGNNDSTNNRRKKDRNHVTGEIEIFSMAEYALLDFIEVNQELDRIWDGSTYENTTNVMIFIGMIWVTFLLYISFVERSHKIDKERTFNQVKDETNTSEIMNKPSSSS